MSQFDFQIGVQVAKVEQLVKTFERLSQVLTNLTGKNYDLNVSLPNKVVNQLNQIKQSLSGIQSNPVQVPISVNQNQVQKVGTQIATGIKSGFQSVISPSFINQLLTPLTTANSKKSAVQLFNGSQNADQSIPFNKNLKVISQLNKEIVNNSNNLSRNGRDNIEWGNSIAQSNANIVAMRGQLGKLGGSLEQARERTGKNFSRAANEISKMNQQLDIAQANVGRYSKEQQIATQIDNKRNSALINQAINQKDVNERLDFAIEKLILYRVAFAAMQKVGEAFTGSLKTFVDLEQIFANIEKVLNPTADQFERIKDVAFQLGQSFGAPIKSVAETMQIWAQAGLNVEQSIEATKASLLGQNAIGLDAVSITDALTAALFGYKKEVGELTSVIDGWMAVQAKYPLSAADLAGALKRVGAAGAELGVDLNTLNGYIAAINATTRKAGGEIGNSLKTVFARIPRSETIKILKDLGISAFTVGGEFRRLEDIVNDVGEKWSQFDTIQKKTIATALGGVHRYVDVIALFSNYSIAQQAAVESEKAFGSSLSANQIQLATTASQIERLSAIFTKIGFQLGESLIAPFKVFGDALETVSKIMANNQGFAKFLAFFASVSVTIIAVVAAFHGFNFVISRTLTALGQLVPSLLATSGAAKTVQITIDGITHSTQVFQTNAAMLATKIAGAFGIVIAVIGAVATVISLLSGKVTQQIDTSNLLNDSFEAQYKAIQNVSTGLHNEIKLIGDLDARRAKLIKSIDSETQVTEKQKAQKQELIAVNEALSKISADLSIALSGVGSSTDLAKRGQDEYKKAIDKTIESEKELLKIQEEKFKLLLSSVDTSGGLQGIQEQISLVEEQRKGVLETAKSFAILGSSIDKAFVQSLGKLDGFGRKLKENLQSQITQNQGNIFEQLWNSATQGPAERSFRFTVKQVIEDPLKEEMDRIKNTITFDKNFLALPLDKRTEILAFFDGWSSSIDDLDTQMFELLKASENIPEFIGKAQTLIDANLNQGRAITQRFSANALSDLEGLGLKLERLNLAKRAFNPDTNQFDFSKVFQMPETEQVAAIGKKVFATDLAESYKKKIEELNNEFRDTPELLQKTKNMLVSLGKEGTSLTSDLGKFAEKQVESQNNLLQEVINKQTELKTINENLAKNQGFEFDKLLEKYDDSLTKQTDINNAKQDLIDKNKQELSALNKLQSLLESIVVDTQKAGILGNWIVNATILEKKIKEAEFASELFTASMESLKDALTESGSTEKEINSQLIEEYKNRVAILKAQEANTSEIELQKELQKQIKDVLVNISKLQFKSNLIDWKKENANLINFKSNLKGSLESGLGSITDIFVKEKQARTDITKDILDKEKELRDNISEGDQNAIRQSQKDLADLNKEMGRHTFILREVADIFGNIFKSLADTFFKQQVEDFAKNISSLIKIKPLKVDPIEVSAENFSTTVKSSTATIESSANFFYNRIASAVNLLSNALTNSAGLMEEISKMSSKTGKTEISDTKLKMELDQPKTTFQSQNEGKPLVDATKNSASNIEESAVKFKDIIVSASHIFSTLLSNTLVSALGGGANAVAGSGIGSQLGGLLSQLEKFGKGTNPLVNLGLGLAGGLLGGLFGSIFDSNDSNTVATIENTKAIEANTQALEELGRQVINATTRFRLPALGGGAVSAGISIGTINITGNQNGQQTYQEFKKALERDYGRSINTSYTRSRIM